VLLTEEVACKRNRVNLPAPHRKGLVRYPVLCSTTWTYPPTPLADLTLVNPLVP
jgi:hypothetical protein